MTSGAELSVAERVCCLSRLSSNSWCSAGESQNYTISAHMDYKRNYVKSALTEVQPKSSILKAAYLNLALFLTLVHVHGTSTPLTTTMTSYDVNMQLGY